MGYDRAVHRADPMRLLQGILQGQSSRDFIDSDSFIDLIDGETEPLFTLARMILEGAEGSTAYTRPFLGRLIAEATRVEELLDQSGARNNRTWFPFRELVAAVRLFARTEYTLLHLQSSAPIYHLLPIEEDFLDATREAIVTVGRILEQSSSEILQLARKLGFEAEGISPIGSLREVVPPGALLPDRRRRHMKEPGKTVCYLATAFLNLSEESRPLEIYKDVRECDYPLCIPDSISEEALREIENKFHSLQSLYDTHISDSDIEDQDENLRIMRGHVSIIFHLLETATELTHYYERHMTILSKGLRRQFKQPVTPEVLLGLLMNYSIAYSHRFVKAAQSLCQEILRAYAEQSAIEVTVPKYRGFHVRPSTLVAKIIMHYGSKVDMLLEGEVYDASRPLELFRANEQINARKRKYIASQIARLPGVHEIDSRDSGLLKAGLKKIWFELLKNHSLIVYDQDFSRDDLEPSEGETLVEYAKRWIAHCLALGKIDIDADIVARFVGDKRVLEDIKLLVDFGYGEDKFGNNLVLPQKLSYLRR